MPGAKARGQALTCLCRFAHPAAVAELVDALDLGSSGVTRGGSSPLSRTKSMIASIARWYVTAWSLPSRRPAAASSPSSEHPRRCAMVRRPGRLPPRGRGARKDCAGCASPSKHRPRFGPETPETRVYSGVVCAALGRIARIHALREGSSQVPSDGGTSTWRTGIAGRAGSRKVVCSCVITPVHSRTGPRLKMTSLAGIPVHSGAGRTIRHPAVSCSATALLK